MRWRISTATIALLCGCFLITSLLIGNTGWTEVKAFGFALTTLSTGFAAMICFIGWVVLRFAAVQVRGEQEEHRFHRWLVLVLVSILTTALADHYLLFWLAWVTVSLSLHQLLLFYPQRPRAQLAAHKKFIFARIAELLLGAALIWLWYHTGTTHISQLTEQGSLMNQQVPAVLLVLVALLKCAQLPVHGWLLQVVEAPTAVSALLHAGIINLGGFLLLQFAPVLSDAPLARWLLALVAGLSMLVAAVVTMTRISIKVRLAWSTVAQMALMLVEISLGYYTLAALHLLAHSCYKAYAFLSSGSAVELRERQRFVGLALPPFSAVIVTLVSVCSLVLITVIELDLLTYVAPWLAVSLALSLWLASYFERFAWAEFIPAMAIAMIWLSCYGAALWLLKLHLEFVEAPLVVGLDLWVSSVLIAITGVYLWLLYRPQAAHSSKLFIMLNAGLYLDEWATRLTLTLWPLRASSATTGVPR